MPSTSPPAVAADSYNSSGFDNSKGVIDHMGTASAAAAAASNCKQQFTSKVGTKQRRLVELYDVSGKVCDFRVLDTVCVRAHVYFAIVAICVLLCSANRLSIHCCAHICLVD